MALPSFNRTARPSQPPAARRAWRLAPAMLAAALAATLPATSPARPPQVQAVQGERGPLRMVTLTAGL